MSCQYFRYSCLQTIKRFCNDLARITRSSARTEISLSSLPNIFSELFGLPKISEEIRKYREPQGLARVVNAIHRINHYPADSVVCFVTFIHWIVIYLVDSVVQPLKKWGQIFCSCKINKSDCSITGQECSRTISLEDFLVVIRSHPRLWLLLLYQYVYERACFIKHNRLFSFLLQL